MKKRTAVALTVIIFILMLTIILSVVLIYLNITQKEGAKRLENYNSYVQQNKNVTDETESFGSAEETVDYQLDNWESTSHFDNGDSDVDLTQNNLGNKLTIFLTRIYGEDFTCVLESAGDLALIYTVNGTDTLYYYAGDDSVELNGEKYYLE